MLTSMTGFGEAAVSTSRFRALIRITAVNSRFLDIRFNHGHLLAAYEPEWTALVQERIRRGKVEVAFYASFLPSPDLIGLDDAWLEAVGKVLDRASAFCSVRRDVSLSDLLALREAVADPGTERTFTEEEAVLLRSAFLEALERLCAMRRTEGGKTFAVLRAESERLRELLESIRRRKAEIDAALRDRLMERARLLLDDSRIDQNRLYLELSFALGRMDISEELERIASHLDQFDRTLEEGGAVGKKLDFLAQELLREANTVASKAQDAETARTVVEFKTGLERIKEQVQNVE